MRGGQGAGGGELITPSWHVDDLASETAAQRGSLKMHMGKYIALFEFATQSARAACIPTTHRNTEHFYTNHLTKRAPPVYRLGSRSRFASA